MQNIPLRPVQAQGGTAMRINLDRDNTVESGSFQAKCLAATADTEFCY